MKFVKIVVAAFFTAALLLASGPAVQGAVVSTAPKPDKAPIFEETASAASEADEETLPVRPVAAGTVKTRYPLSREKARFELLFYSESSQPVYAAKGGTITAVGLHWSQGACVTIRQEDGLYATYAHLSTYKGEDAVAISREGFPDITMRVAVGQAVKAGEIIGDTGTTGSAKAGAPVCGFWLRREKAEQPEDAEEPVTEPLKGQEVLDYLGIDGALEAEIKAW